jgi:diguanylate cyclase (GGDEF)-like protein
VRALVLVVLALVGIIGWSSVTMRERGEEIRAISAETNGLEIVGRVRDSVRREAAGLIDLKVLPGDTGALSARLIGVEVPDDALRFARQADGEGAQLFVDLNMNGFGAGEGLSVALRELQDADFQAMGLGSMISVDAGRYSAALDEVARLEGEAAARARVAAVRLNDLSATWAPWGDPRWWLVMLAMLALGVLAMSDLRRSIESSEEHRRTLVADKDQMRDVLSATNALAEASDVDDLCHRLADVARRLSEADFAVVFIKDQAIVKPLGLSGNVSPGPVRPGEGVVAQVQVTGEVVSRTLLADPSLPSLVGQASVVAVPIEQDQNRLGVLLVGQWTSKAIAAESVSAVRLLAMTVGRNFSAVVRHQHNGALVNVDALTGLYNRRKLDGDLAAKVQNLVSEGRPVAFAMVDVDHFKKFNDTFGHPAGDALLRQVARAISNAVRGDDVVYRYGGEEFCVLLPGASPDEARTVGERIRWAVEHTPVIDERGLQVQSVTVSIGLSTAATSNPAALVASADAALYQAKQSGRNRVVEAA